MLCQNSLRTWRRMSSFPHWQRSISVLFQNNEGSQTCSPNLPLFPAPSNNRKKKRSFQNLETLASWGPRSTTATIIKTSPRLKDLLILGVPFLYRRSKVLVKSPFRTQSSTLPLKSPQWPNECQCLGRIWSWSIQSQNKRDLGSTSWLFSISLALEMGNVLWSN